MINIRKMEQRDADEVFDMMRVFYNSPAVFHTSSDEVLRRDIEDCISDMPLVDGFVFEEEGQLLGYAMTALNYTTEYGGISVWIEDLYLKPEARRKGIATEFFAYIEKAYPQAVRFKLEVEQENEAAIATYKRNGYEISPYFEMTKEMIEDQRMMETWYYEVVSIDGDYANLKRTDVEIDDEKLVARALLPAEINVGTKLKYELMQYEIM